MIKIDIDRTMLKQALEQAINSLKRAENKQFNPAMKELIIKDIAIYTNAMNTMTETK